MNGHFRKLYLHLDHPEQNVDVRVGKLDARTRSNNSGCTHYLHFTCNGLYTRVWVNLLDIQMRRDLTGVYLMDFRDNPMNDRIICTREARDRVSHVRPDIGTCEWRYEGDED